MLVQNWRSGFLFSFFFFLKHDIYKKIEISYFPIASKNLVVVQLLANIFAPYSFSAAGNKSHSYNFLIRRTKKYKRVKMANIT